MLYILSTFSLMETPLNTILSFESNVMLAALLSLILVVVFVILLHIYARCYLAPVPITSDGVSASAPIVPLALGARFYRLHNLLTPDTLDSARPVKGLASSVISTIPRFVYKVVDDQGHGLVCVICLSLFGDNEVGRKLQSCGHSFHVECIDMWLFSHTTCPICRAPALALMVVNESDDNGSSSDPYEIDVGEVVDGVSDESSLTEIVIESCNVGNELNDTTVSKILVIE